MTKHRIRFNFAIFSALISLTVLILFDHVLTASATGAAPSGDATRPATSGDVVALIAFVLLALVFSSLCSIAEAVLLNITPSYIADLQEKKPDFAEKVKRLRQDDVDKSLAGILTMNTIAHTVGAIGSGAKATIVFGSAWFGVFSAIMTLLILFVSEIVPKTVGVVYWRQLVRAVISYVSILGTLLWPIIWISEFITKAIAKGRTEHVFNTDEFVAMATMGEESGQLDKNEVMIIQNLFKLGTITAEDICTPRTVLVGYNQNSTVKEVLAKEESVRVSRILIHEGNFDKITGFVLKDELLLLEAQDKGDTQISKLRRDITVIPGGYKISKLMELFLKNRQQIAVVVDEFSTIGVVTIEDVLETLIGTEIMDETDQVADLREHAKAVWGSRVSSMGAVLDDDEEEQEQEEKMDENKEED